MSQQINKLAKNLKIILVIIFAIALFIGVILTWQYLRMPVGMPEEIGAPENKVIEEIPEIEETECEKWRKECAEEGESLCSACGCKRCCPGSVKREVTHPYRNKNNEVFCLEEMKAYTCVKCGDKICGKGEDWCICPEDCLKPNPEDLQIFIISE